MKFRILNSDFRCPATARAAARRARGFSFTELLFAVMIMGIGFIMIAAIFPVGLSQSKSNFDETQASTVARGAVAAIEGVATDTNMPSNASVLPLQALVPSAANAALTSTAHVNMINSADPRYAWVGLYHRTAAADQFAQLLVFVVNRSDPFTTKDFTQTNSTRRLEPRGVRIDIDPATKVVTISQLGTAAGANTANASAALPGAFIVIANDSLAGTTGMVNPAAGAAVGAATAVNGQLNGRVYRLGNQTGTNTFELMPGYEFKETIQDIYDHDTNASTASVDVEILGLDDARGYIIGRDRPGSGGAASDFEGGVMDVAYYTTFIAIK